MLEDVGQCVTPNQMSCVEQKDAIEHMLSVQISDNPAHRHSLISIYGLYSHILPDFIVQCKAKCWNF